MRAIKIKSGGQAYVLEKGETCPPGGICFMGDEWEWALRLSKSFQSDPEQLKGFWSTVMDHKKTVPGYTVFMSFPKEPEHKTKNMEICADIIRMLKGRRGDTIQE